MKRSLWEFPNYYVSQLRSHYQFAQRETGFSISTRFNLYPSSYYMRTDTNILRFKRFFTLYILRI